MKVQRAPRRSLTCAPSPAPNRLLLKFRSSTTSDVLKSLDGLHLKGCTSFDPRLHLISPTSRVALISRPFAIALLSPLRLLQRTQHITSMAPRARRTEFSSRVTIYEPAADATAATTTSITPVKRTRLTRSTASSSAAGSSAAATTKEEDEEDEEKPVKVAKKATTPRKPKPFQEKLEKAHPEPKRWRDQYEAIRKQRETVSEVRLPRKALAYSGSLCCRSWRLSTTWVASKEEEIEMKLRRTRR